MIHIQRSTIPVGTNFELFAQSSLIFTIHSDKAFGLLQLVHIRKSSKFKMNPQNVNRKLKPIILFVSENENDSFWYNIDTR